MSLLSVACRTYINSMFAGEVTSVAAMAKQFCGTPTQVALHIKRACEAGLLRKLETAPSEGKTNYYLRLKS